MGRLAGVLEAPGTAVRTVVRHPNGVMVDGRLFLRDDYYAAEHASLREWAALGVLVVGLVMWIVIMVGGLVWVVSEVLHRWR